MNKALIAILFASTAVAQDVPEFIYSDNDDGEPAFVSHRALMVTERVVTVMTTSGAERLVVFQPLFHDQDNGVWHLKIDIFVMGFGTDQRVTEFSFSVDDRSVSFTPTIHRGKKGVGLGGAEDNLFQYMLIPNKDGNHAVPTLRAKRAVDFLDTLETGKEVTVSVTTESGKVEFVIPAKVQQHFNEYYVYLRKFAEESGQSLEGALM